MKNWKFASSDWVLVLLAGVVMPVIVVAGLLAAGRPEAAGVIGILAAIFLGMVTLGTYTALGVESHGERRTMTLAANIISDIESIPELEWLDTVRVEPPSPVTVEVTGATGVYARGFTPGNVVAGGVGKH